MLSTVRCTRAEPPPRQGRILGLDQLAEQLGRRISPPSMTYQAQRVGDRLHPGDAADLSRHPPGGLGPVGVAACGVQGDGANI
jgi:hypothetical protein